MSVGHNPRPEKERTPPPPPPVAARDVHPLDFEAYMNSPEVIAESARFRAALERILGVTA